MKQLIIIFFTISSTLFAELPSYNEVRTLYKNASYQENACKKLITMLNHKAVLNDETLLGYKACATMIMAKYLYNPFSKISNFNNGKTLLEKALNLNPNNAELRYLRLSIQVNAPSFLKYNSDIVNDKEFLLKNWSGLTDQSLKKDILSFLLQSNYVTNQEKQKLM